MPGPAAPFDLAIVGGGINGAGIARDAAGRGLRVLLVERGDLGGATSSASSKLVHGGLRYLERYEFRLVAESLAEREVLLRIAPHLVRPLAFVLPHRPHLRPRWFLRLGLALYDVLARGKALPGSRSVRLTPGGYGAGLRADLRHGLLYWDCAVDDARLVVLNARSAAERGATVLPRTRCVGGHREHGLWVLDLRDVRSSETRRVAARALVNAGGPWVQEVLGGVLHIRATGQVRLVKGSHIVVPRLHDQPHAYLLQNADGRIVFLLPYEDDFTSIGTTDVPVDGPDAPAPSAEEIDYLCATASEYAAQPVRPESVRASWSGVRPLYDDGTDDPAAVTRDYRFVVDAGERGDAAPLLSIYGGKLTTYRVLAERALRALARWLPQGREWTGVAPLPGGDLGGEPFDALVQAYAARYPQLDRRWLERLLRRHGTCAAELLGDARREADLGEAFGGGLYARELEYLVAREWAQTAEDVLWRRTKCGLRMTSAQRERVAERLGIAA